MVNNIYPESVFDAQTNGTVFYKQGHVMDLPKAGPGVYESWRYNFDAGKAIFRAEGTKKVYEKRLVKDNYGVPRWTSWMEISQAETHGVQAIAINDGVLRLPNEDGAIKLELTPNSLGIYSRTETDRLIDQKINEFDHGKYIYVPWALEAGTNAPRNWTPLQVLEEAYPSGGETQLLYLVAAKPAQPPVPSLYPKVTQFIWDIVGTSQGGKLVYGWIETGAAAELEAFVTYGVFDAHRMDADRDFPETKHVTPLEKILINNSVQADDYDAHLKGQSKNPETDYFNLHATPVEKAYWNSKMNNTPLGMAHKRYVASTPDGTSTEWEQALEQVNYGEDKHDFYRPWGSNAHQFSQEIYKFPKSWLPDIKKLLAEGSLPLSVKVTFDTLDTKGSDVFFEFNDDPKFRSPKWNTSVANQPEFSFEVPIILDHDHEGAPIYFETIKYVVTNPAQVYTTVGNLAFDLSFRNPNRVDFGLSLDYDVNFIGKNLTLNGQDLGIQPSAGNTAKWGQISGDVAAQTDITQLLFNYTQDKLALAPAVADVRYDVINRNKYVASLVQHTANTRASYELCNIDPIVPVPGNNAVLKSGFGAMFDAALADSKKLADVEITDVIIRTRKGIVVPPSQEKIWFYVDNPKANRSDFYDRQQSGLAFEWRLGPVTDWDTIFIGNPPADPSKNAFTHLNELEVIVECIAFDGVIAGRTDKTFTILASKRPEMEFGGKTYEIADKAALDAEIERAKEEEERLDEFIADEIGSVRDDLTELEEKVDEEIERAKEAEDELAEAIAAEEKRATDAEEDLQDQIENEAARASASEEDLDKRLTEAEKEPARAKAAEAALDKKITDEAARATDAEATKVDKDFADSTTGKTITDFSIGYGADLLKFATKGNDLRTKEASTYGFEVTTTDAMHISTSLGVATLDIDHELQAIKKIRTEMIQSPKGADLIRYVEVDSGFEDNPCFYVGAPQYHTVFRAPLYKENGVNYANLVAEIGGTMFKIATTRDIEKWDATVVHLSGAEDIGGVKTFHADATRVKKLSSFWTKGINEPIDLIQYNAASDKVEIGDQTKRMVLYSREEDRNYWTNDFLQYIPDHIRAVIDGHEHWVANYDDVATLEAMFKAALVAIEKKFTDELQKLLDWHDKERAERLAGDDLLELKKADKNFAANTHNRVVGEFFVRSTADPLTLEYFKTLVSPVNGNSADYVTKFSVAGGLKFETEIKNVNNHNYVQSMTIVGRDDELADCIDALVVDGGCWD